MARRPPVPVLVVAGIVLVVVVGFFVAPPVDRVLARLAGFAGGGSLASFVAGAGLGCALLLAGMLARRLGAPLAAVGPLLFFLGVLALPPRRGDPGEAGQYVRWGVIAGLTLPFFVRVLDPHRPRGSRHGLVLCDVRPERGHEWTAHWLPTCDCGWQGEPFDDEEAARYALMAHAPGLPIEVQRPLG